LKNCVKNLVRGKFANAGQTCIAPDYVFVEKSIEIDFLRLLKKEILQTKYTLTNRNYARIINEQAFERLIGLLQEEKVYIGGVFDRETRFLSPTVLINISKNDKAMENEILGPILPILTYDHIGSVISFVKSRPKPLALYLFSNSKFLRQQILNEISFGGGMCNGVLTHFQNTRLPFGGVGQSGIGYYHGEVGFRTFSHFKSFMLSPRLIGFSP